MNSIKTIIVAAALFVGYLGAAQAAETIKPLQGMSFHTRSTDAVAYFTADKGKCSLVLTVTDKFAYARFGGRRSWFECQGCWRRCRVL